MAGSSVSSLEKRSRLLACWESKLEWDNYPQTIKEGFQQVGNAISMPAGAVLSGVMILVSFMLAHSTVGVPGTDWREPVILWLAICMPSGTGKSPLSNYLQQILQKVRTQCCGKTPQVPWTVDEASFEKMGALMAENNGKLLGLYDELTSFLSRMNLCKSKGTSDSHDIATFLKLYNGYPWTRATVSGDANFAMEYTALTIGGFTQPPVARSIIEQSGNVDKGLCQRFLWIFTEPVFAKFDTLAPISGTFTASLVDLLVNLWKINNKAKTPRELKIPEKCVAFQVKYDDIQEKLQQLCTLDELVSGILSKQKGQILRVAAIFHALFSIDEEYVFDDTISTQAIAAAINFVEACGEHCASIAGRKGTTIQEPSTPIQSTDDEATAAFCLQLPGSTLDLTRLLNAKKFRSRGNKEGALKAMRLLAYEGLGELEERHGRGSNKQYIFKKRPLPDEEEEDEKIELARKLRKFDLSLQSYSNSFVEKESTMESNAQTTPQRPL